MAKLKLTIKKPIKEKLSLVEHVNVDGADYINTALGCDVFRIRTWEAQQSFVVCGTTNACNFTQSAETFNSNIRDGHTLFYMFALEDTNQVIGAVITLDEGHTSEIHIGESNSYIRANIGFENENQHADIVHGNHLIPLYLIPDVALTFVRLAGDDDGVLEQLHLISNLDIPAEPEEPAEEPEEEEAEEEPAIEVDDAEVEVDDAEAEPEEEDGEPEATETPTANEEPVEEPAARPAYTGSPFRYKVVGKEVYITHVKLTPEMRASHTINIPATIEDKPVTKLWKNCIFINELHMDYNVRWHIRCTNNLKEIKNYAITFINLPYLDRVILDGFTGKKYTYSIYKI